MLLLGFDLETTGLSPQTDRIVELGYCLWDTVTHTPLLTGNDILLQEAPIPAETIRIHGITDEMTKLYGVEPKLALNTFSLVIKTYKPAYLVAHNGFNFDLPFLLAEYKRHGVDSSAVESVPLIDTRTDIPFEVEPDSRRLKHLALDHGFINPFPHRALFDVLTMLKVLSHHDIAKIVEYQKIPWIIVRAMVSYEERDLAKAQRYSWQVVGDKTFPKAWVKAIKDIHFEKEKAACPFQVVKIE